jgi:hypothetical protein
MSVACMEITGMYRKFYSGKVKEGEQLGAVGRNGRLKSKDTSTNSILKT